MAADAEDKHLMVHMIPVNLTMVQESGGKNLVPDAGNASAMPASH
jgi:hypothetical protein